MGPKLVVLGDEPQRYGLGVSLLQRLHKQYQHFGEPAVQYIVSLNCNYRCQAELLELPSTLFYDSALESCGDTKCCSSIQYPLLFICSSFDNSIPTSPESLNEALLILHEVKELLKYKEWCTNDVCIMTASLNQVWLQYNIKSFDRHFFLLKANVIHREIYKSSENTCLRGVKVCTSFQMQGMCN